MRTSLLLLALIFTICDSNADQVKLTTKTLFYRPQVNDIRAMAMGNTEILSSRPVNGTLSNPALLTKQGQLGFTIGFKTLSGFNDISPVNKREAGIRKLSYESEIKGANHINNISMGFTMPEREKNFDVSFGLSYQKLYAADYLHEHSLLLYMKNDGFYYLKTHFDQNEVLEFVAPTIAIRIRNLSLGISFDKCLEKNKLDYEYEWYEVLRGSYSDSTIYHSDVYQDDLYPNDGFISLGMLYQFHKIQIGAIYRTMMEYHQKGDVAVSLDPFWYIRTPDQDLNYYDKVPSILGLAVSYKPIDKLIFAGEIQTRSFSQMDYYIPDIKDGYAKRLGVEYEFMEGVNLRAGYYQENIFAFHSYSNSPLNMNGLTAGLGISKEHVSIDLALEYCHFDQILDGDTRINGNTFFIKNDNKILVAGTTISYSF